MGHEQYLSYIVGARVAAAFRLVGVKGDGTIIGRGAVIR